MVVLEICPMDLPEKIEGKQILYCLDKHAGIIVTLDEGYVSLTSEDIHQTLFNIYLVKDPYAYIDKVLKTIITFCLSS